MNSQFSNILEMLAAEHSRTVDQLNAQIAKMEVQLELAMKRQANDSHRIESQEPYDSPVEGALQSSQQPQQSNGKSERLLQQSEGPVDTQSGLKVDDQSDPQDQQQKSGDDVDSQEGKAKTTGAKVNDKIKKHMRTSSTPDIVRFSSSPPHQQFKHPGWQAQLKKTLSSPMVEGMVGVLIVLNTLVMALETQYHGDDAGYKAGFKGMDTSAQETWGVAGEVFVVTEKIFTIIYTAELVLRLAVLRLEFFMQAFHYVDFLVVIIGLLDWILGSMTVNPAMIRFLRIAKLVRGLRLLHTGHVFDFLHLLLQCLASSLVTLFWTCSLLTVFQMLVAMLLSQMTLPYIKDESQPEQGRMEVFAFYGTFTRSMLTTFEVMLANWSPACRVLVNNISEWYSLFFLFYRCIAGFAVLNVINAVFIQTTLKVAQADKDVMIMQKERAQEDFARKLETLFKELDESGDGVLELDEFKDMMSHPHMGAWMSALEIDPQDMEGLFVLLDDGNGKISLSEFMMGVSRIKGNAKSIDMAHTLATLKRLDYKLNCLLTQESELSI